MLQNHNTKIWLLAPLPTSSVTLGKALNPPGPQFPVLENGGSSLESSTMLIEHLLFGSTCPRYRLPPCPWGACGCHNTGSVLHLWWHLCSFFWCELLYSWFIFSPSCQFCLFVIQFSSVTAHWYPTLGNPMDCSTPGFPVHHQLPELAQTHVHHDGAWWWCRPAISSSVIPFSSCLQFFPAFLDF